MAILNINVGGGEFNVQLLSVTSTECSDILEYQINADSGDALDIVLTGDFTSEFYILDGVTTGFTGSTSVVFGNSLIVRFAIENSGIVGLFHSATISVTNNTTTQPANVFSLSHTRNSDAPKCGPGGIGAQTFDALTDTPNDKIGNALRFVRVNAGETDLEYADSPGGATQLVELTDVFNADPTNRNVLVANGSLWASRPLVEADISDLQNYLISGDNVSELVNDAGYITSETPQTLSWDGGTGNLSISLGNTVNLDDRYGANDIDYVSNVILNGTDLEFTGVGNAFASTVDLSSLADPAQDLQSVLDTGNVSTTGFRINSADVTIGKAGESGLAGNQIFNVQDLSNTITGTYIPALIEVRKTGGGSGFQGGIYSLSVSEDPTNTATIGGASLFGRQENPSGTAETFELFGASIGARINGFGDNRLAYGMQSELEIIGTQTGNVGVAFAAYSRVDISNTNKTFTESVFNHRFETDVVSGVTVPDYTHLNIDVNVPSNFTAGNMAIIGVANRPNVPSQTRVINSLLDRPSRFVGAIEMEKDNAAIDAYPTGTILITRDYFNANIPTDTNDIDYVSGVSLVGTDLTFVGVGNAFSSTVDLSSLADTNDIDYISNVVLNVNTLEFTGVGNAFSANIDLSGLVTANDFLNGASFNTADGVLTMTVSNQADVTVDLDGRYLQDAPSDGNQYARENGTWTVVAASGVDLTTPVNQVAHGFSVGDVIRLNGSTYTEAQADTEPNANAIALVVEVVDVDNFVLQSFGLTSIALGLTNGDEAWLSTTTAGTLQTTEPTASEINVFIGQQTPQGFLINIGQGYIFGGAGGGGSTDYVSNVILNGTDLEFTGVGSAFNGTVDLASLGGGGSTDYISGGSFGTGTGDLTLTGVGSAGATINLDGRYLQNIVEDLTPQLGGSLDLQTFDIFTNDPNVIFNLGDGNASLSGSLNFQKDGLTQFGLSFGDSTSFLLVGANNSRNGIIQLYSDNTTGSGEVQIFNGNSVDANVSAWVLKGNTTGDFIIADNFDTEFFKIDETSKQISLPTYGSNTYTGTATRYLAVDASGNVIEEAVPAVGTTDYVSNVTLVGTELQFTGIGSAFNSNVDIASINSNDIDYISGASFNTGNGVLTLTGVGNAGATVDLDGRYSTTDTNDIDYVSNVTFNDTNGNLTFTGIGNAFNTSVNLDGRYLTSFTETDPVFTASPAAGITALQISNWDTAFSWGDHALAGYITGVNLSTGYNATFITIQNSEGNNAGVNAFNDTLAGVTPASGGGTVNFLRADGTWAQPPAGGGTTLEETVNQVGHGLVVGDWIRLNGSTYVVANATDSTNAAVLGVVSAVADVDNFTFQYGGNIALAGLTDGESYFLQNGGGIGTTPGTINQFVGTETPQGFLIEIGQGFIEGAGPTTPLEEEIVSSVNTEATATGTLTLDSSVARLHRVTLTGNTDITLSTGLADAQSCVFQILITGAFTFSFVGANRTYSELAGDTYDGATDNLITITAYKVGADTTFLYQIQNV